MILAELVLKTIRECVDKPSSELSQFLGSSHLAESYQ